jgi:lipid-binding SYLF domain-containing protein
MHARIVIGLGLVGLMVAGCATPAGNSVSEKRTSVRRMRSETLAELYAKKPIAKESIAKAAGYAVFSNININLLILSSGNGYGVARDAASGQDVYMRMQMLGVGLGAGVKDFRAVMIFKTPEALHLFTEKGWEWGGHADAAAKSGKKGKAASAAGDISGDMEIYTFTESGIALQATVAGTKYWKDDDLN